MPNTLKQQIPPQTGLPWPEVAVDNTQTVQAFTPEVHEREWGQEIFIARTPHYLGKLLVMKAGTAGGMQFHVEKYETFYLQSGQAEVEYDDGKGSIVTVQMAPGQSFQVPPGAVHRTTAITDCVFIETSTPHYDDRVHAEHLYGRGNPTGGLPSTWLTDDGRSYRRIGGRS